VIGVVLQSTIAITVLFQAQMIADYVAEIDFFGQPAPPASACR
jgi:hypothetical protein